MDAKQVKLYSKTTKGRYYGAHMLYLTLPKTYFIPYSAGTDFSRQNLTSVDVRFWRLNSIPAL